MTLPKEVLDEMATYLDTAAAAIKSLEDVVLDAKVAEIDVTKQEIRLDKLKEDYRKLKIFHDRQVAKAIE